MKSFGNYCKLAADFGSESGTCPCEAPGHCRFGRDARKGYKALKVIFKEAKAAVEKID